MKSLIDVHTHSIASGHAYSSLTEMIAEGQRKGLSILGVTEHGISVPGTCDPLYFKSYWVVPRQYGSMRLMLGAELNILDTEGHIDMTEKDWRRMDLRIAGIHSVCWKGGSPEENTAGVVAAMHNPFVQIISHPGDGTADLIFEPIVKAAKETGTLLEINNCSLRPGRGKAKARGNNLEILSLCRKYDVPVIVGSDAHILYDIATHEYAMGLIEEAGFPEELVLNDKPELFLSSLKATPRG